MNYKGIIIAESLGDPTIFQDVKMLATKVEPVTEKHKTPWLTKWTLHTVEIPEEKADAFAQKVSTLFDQNHLTSWFVDFKNDSQHFIIFPNKIFKIDVSNPVLYQEVKQYGISLGIPEHQLAFSPDV